MTTEPTTENALPNAMHAASAWLERIGADPAAVAVVTIWPSASVGVWTPGSGHVEVRRHIDDAGAEVAEAVAPVVHLALRALPDAARTAAINAAATGARLQALLAPAVGEFTLRLVHAGRVVELASINATCTLH